METAKALTRWRQAAIPFWVERSWDDALGGFHEALDFKGVPLSDAKKRVRVQARQIYCFAMFHILGWADTLPRAEQGWAYVRDRARHPDAGYVHRLTASGEQDDKMRDLYDHAFLLLAASTLLRATGHEMYRHDCEALLAFLDRDMTHPAGGYVEALDGPVSPRRQNPHMHLFEALMAYHEAGGDGALDRAARIRDIFLERFYAPDTAKLYEFFEDDLRTVCATRGPVAEPGHLSEWVWLLDQFSRLSGEALNPAAQELYACVMAQGINRDTGLLFASIQPDGQPIDPASRTWMQTEWYRAAAVAKRHGFAGADEGLKLACRGLCEVHFAGLDNGGWQDRIDARGAAAMDRMPASTLYHVLGALIEAEKLLDTQSR